MDDIYWGIIGFVAVLGLMSLGIHVGLALAATGFIGMFLMTGRVSLALALFTITPYSTTNVYAFAILPLFILMGLFAMHAGLSARAFDAAYKWVGRLPGVWPSPPPGPTPCSPPAPAPAWWPAPCSPE